jgi:hypothetical protein
MGIILKARALGPGDGASLAKLTRKITPLHGTVFKRLPDIYEKLLAEDAGVGAIVESIDIGTGNATLAGAAYLGFVHDHVVASYLKAPHPALSSSLFMRVTDQSLGPFMNQREQAEGNLGQGLEQIILEFGFGSVEMGHPEFAAVMNELFTAHFAFERGYNIKGISVEASASFDAFMTGTGLRKLMDFDLAGTNLDIVMPIGPVPQRGFYRVVRKDLPSLSPTSAAAIILTYMKPTFRFTPHEQRLLTRAISGLTDEAIAEQLDISRDAVKQSWRTIYDHVLDVMPELLKANETQEKPGGRGSEKRRRIVAHVRGNLQELRPHYQRRG